MTRQHLLAASLTAAALVGASLVVLSGGGEPALEMPLPTSPEAAHAAAGVVTGTGPEVAAAFTQRVAELQARLASSPNDRATLLELARLFHDGHRSAEAVVHYRRAIELDPTEAQPYYDLASVYAQLSDWPGARSALQERLARAPDDAVAMYDMGAVEANAGESEQAVLWWHRAGQAAKDPELRGRIDAALSQLASPPDPPRPR